MSADPGPRGGSHVGPARPPPGRVQPSPLTRASAELRDLPHAAPVCSGCFSLHLITTGKECLTGRKGFIACVPFVAFTAHLEFLARNF